MAETKSFTFTALPKSVSELQSWSGYDMKDPYCVAAMAIAALCEYPENKDASIDMINTLKGPAELSPMDKQFIRDRFMDGKGYVPLSYFNGAAPDNNYQPQLPYTISLFANPYSDSQEGYKKLYVRSGGADSERPITLRNKPSTGEWFLWEFNGILAGIRTPKADDPWA